MADEIDTCNSTGYNLAYDSEFQA